MMILEGAFLSLGCALLRGGKPVLKRESERERTGVQMQKKGNELRRSENGFGELENLTQSKAKKSEIYV